jgi:uncharacterized protein
MNNKSKKNLLFYFTHPSKYHLFKNSINALIELGHNVEVLNITKDILDELVSSEKWQHKNIFPEGRKIKWLPKKVAASFNLLRTLYRLNNYLRGKNFDLFITDDILTLTGKIKKIPVILFQDDDLKAVPESFILLATADYILAPACTDFGRYNSKKIGIKGYKQSSYLHPNNFKLDRKIINKHIQINTKYVIIRLVSLIATHDVGKKGLSNDDVLDVIKKLEKKYLVCITSERKLPEYLEKYRLKDCTSDILHLLGGAEMLISDSQTMSAEAALLGTPYIRFNDFVGRINYLEELENKYHLGLGIRSKNKDILFNVVDEFMQYENIRENWKVKRDLMISETIDLEKFMIWLFSDFGENIEILKRNPDYQKIFI